MYSKQTFPLTKKRESFFQSFCQILSLNGDPSLEKCTIGHRKKRGSGFDLCVAKQFLGVVNESHFSGRVFLRTFKWKKRSIRFCNSYCLGAGFVNLLACTPSIAAKITAFATVSAAFYTTTFNGNCPTQRPIPILDFHGIADTVASYNGGQAHGATLVSVDGFRQGWALRNGCSGKPTISHLSKEIDPRQLVQIQIWNTDCIPGGILVGYKITKGQHAWPRTTLPRKCYENMATNDCTTTVFDATSTVIIPFFDAFALQL